ncbi:rhamnogalacturonan acetylesterase [Kitasatospora atroaurantiaca]|uniref:Lysophospholipase L1-like esterase n=1 Tax=Kitasatospora atroaurantiaca TaxID=285545 RepID=A0A561EKQ2_9ACTN|nr:rhamnogalacturonan acetylesterase [Kitasatospora atroaurantiaca]TWE16181.1 lysophospholipase L1-like esterase [Kitasatospora atroaurantiaca]
MTNISRRALARAAAVAPLIAALGTSKASAAPRVATVYVAGDSTASVYHSTEAPRAGWGQALPVFATPRLAVDDRALSGASSKSFYDLGLLDGILADIRPGDRLLVSFGHNDEKVTDPARGTDPYTTYQDYLRRYLDGARQRGALPVLVTSVERRRFDAQGRAYASHGLYPQAMRDLAAREKVPLIDLQALSLSRWEQLGAEATKLYFLWLAAGLSPNYPTGAADNTHFQAHGAIEVARLVAQELHRQRLLPPGSLRRLDDAVADDRLHWPSSS